MLCFLILFDKVSETNGKSHFHVSHIIWYPHKSPSANCFTILDRSQMGAWMKTFPLYFCFWRCLHVKLELQLMNSTVYRDSFQTKTFYCLTSLAASVCKLHCTLLPQKPAQCPSKSLWDLPCFNSDFKEFFLPKKNVLLLFDVWLLKLH